MNVFLWIRGKEPELWIEGPTQEEDISINIYNGFSFTPIMESVSIMGFLSHPLWNLSLEMAK